MKTTMRMLAASTLIALAPLAGAADTTTGSGSLDTQVKVLDNTGASRGQALVASRIASSFTNLAGSQSNALALVNGLRNGTAITLTQPAPTTMRPGASTTTTTTTTTTSTLTPPTKPMGWGNVKIALALAQAQLQQLGITNPTADQLQAALNGGVIKAADGTSVTLKGVLAMRASGMGWGQIAQAGGTKLGPVISSLRQAQAKVAALPVSRNSSTTTTTTNTSTTTPGKEKSSGITTAAGGAASTAHGGNGAKGLTTAGASAAGSSSRGLVTAEGGTVTQGPKAGVGGRGIVSGGGGGAAAGVTTAHGNAGGNSNGNAGGNGKGKGG